jgi:hypothetical protein
MRRSKFQSLSAIVLACGFGLVACAPKPKTIEATPKSVTLTEAGEKVALKAVAKTEKGEEIKYAKFAFASGDKTVADVSADKGEVVAGKKSGKTKITVSIGEVKAEVPVSVDLYTKIVSEPALIAIKAGETLPLKATVQNEAGAAVADAKVEFKSSDENIAKVDATGSVTGVATGTATLTLTAKKLTATVNVIAAGPQEEASCKHWSTTCRMGRWPDGSERWSGLQISSTKAECEGTREFVGVMDSGACVPCQCLSR